MTAPRGVWRASVARVADGRAFVRVDRLSGHEYGPVDVIEGVWTDETITSADGAHTHTGLSDGVHTHGVAVPLASGDKVLVCFIEGRPDEVVVLGRLTGGV